jgi:hypothetical protein
MAGRNQRAKAYARVEEPPPVEVEHLHRSDKVTVDKTFRRVEVQGKQ